MTIIQGIKVNGAASGTATVSSATNSTAYTAPATGYALIQIGLSRDSGSAQADIQVKIGGRAIYTVRGWTTAFPADLPASNSSGVAQGGTLNGFVVGPSEAVTIFATNYTGGSYTLVVSGVELINTT